jgi:hypothetical protein
MYIYIYIYIVDVLYITYVCVYICVCIMDEDGELQMCTYLCLHEPEIKAKLCSYKKRMGKLIS